MTFTVELGWWLVPTTITIVTFIGTTYYCTSKLSNDPFSALLALLLYGAASIISLLAWVIYLVVV